MLYKSVNLIDGSLKQGPYYIVGEVHHDKTISYIKNLAVKCHPCFPDDEVLEQTSEIWEAQLFCRKEDALSVLKDRCGFGCNCGACNKTGKVWVVTWSGRKKSGITYGIVDCSDPNYHKDRFETVYDVAELESYTQDMK
jgi:hypothetical protein